MDATKNNALKRKRYEPPEEELSVRIGGKLHHEIKEVHKASKRAKVFETQKVVKRMKDLRKKNAEDKAIGQFEEELSTLKDINHDAIGNSAFRTKILKDHLLRDNEDLKNSMSQELKAGFTPAEQGSTLAKIQSRLLSSKILAVQVTASINSLKFLLNPALKQDNLAVSGKAHTTSNNDETERPSKLRKGSSPSDDSKFKDNSIGGSKLDVSLFDKDENNLIGSEEGEDDDAGWESGSIGGDNGGLDAGWESGSIGDGGSESLDESDEDCDSASGSGSDDEELRVNTRKSNPKAVGNAPPAKWKANASSGKMESTFLPSLSVGFVRGSEDSDFSEGEDGKVADMPKKNRRGQRARRAIWEKKFGRNANHKKKEAAELAAAALTQPRRGPGHTSSNNDKLGPNGAPARKSFKNQGPAAASKDASRSKSTPQQHQPADSGWAGRTKDKTAVTTSSLNKSLGRKAAEQGDKPLHPSWEAKRKLKEKESVGIVPSQGKKIKFS